MQRFGEGWVQKGVGGIFLKNSNKILDGQNFLWSHKIAQTERDLLEEIEQAKGLTGAANSRFASVLVHAEGTKSPDKLQEGATKLQEGAQTAAVLVHADGQLGKGLTGPMFSSDPSVLVHADPRNLSAKVHEGALPLGGGGAGSSDSLSLQPQQVLPLRSQCEGSPYQQSTRKVRLKVAWQR